MNGLSRRDALLAIASPLCARRSNAQVTPGVAQFRPEIAPLVSLIENTPREKCAEMMAEQLRRGVSYRQALAALFLAGIRSINPRPPGFALHSVFVIHSAHILGLEAPASARMLPLFYALDNFKIAQDRDARQPAGDYTMRAVTGRVPAPERAASEFTAAMDAWDPERAELASVAVARYRSPAEAAGLLWGLGARDYRNIGHKAIYVANAERTLQTIGWQHAEPVLRSVSLSLVDFGKEQKLNGYGFADQCYEANRRRVAAMFPKLGSGWASEEGRSADTRAVLEAIRSASPEEACALVAARLSKDATAGSVWDAVHLASAELRMRALAGAAILSVHAVTSANALHYSWLASSDPQTRLLILLQAVGWMGQFRSFGETRPETLRAFSITSLEPGEAVPQERALAEIFSAIPSNADGAAAHVMRMAKNPAERQAFQSAAVRAIVTKADEVHHFKYLAALIEDVPLVSAEWQPHLLAASVYYLKSAKDPESATVKRAREVLSMRDSA